ncbi:MAG: hypothetical protein RIR26_2221 [Pseudomonadota bacterium]|jgi:hypothetical protein
MKAVVDASRGGSEAARGETYDPTAAILLFRATSDKISILSRCNARLVHRLKPIHRSSGGGTEPASAPLDFNRLDFQLDNDASTMELHTSSHCFFRIWDPRIPSQVAGNASLGQEPTKSLLSDPLVRYQLYKSMLTSPQKLVSFTPDGSPVEFNYKLTTSNVYDIFFSKIEAQNSSPLRNVVGREFSKTSLILDELAQDVCRADEKTLELLDNSLYPRENIRTIDDISKYKAYSGDGVGGTLRRHLISHGRHKLCFSQNDFIVASISFPGDLSAAQRDHIGRIYDAQASKVSELKSQLTKSLAGNFSTSQDQFVPEFYGTTPALPSAAGQCTNWTGAYPALSVTVPFASKASVAAANWNFDDTTASATVRSWKNFFPNLELSLATSPLVLTYLKSILNDLIAGNKCSYRGFDSQTDIMDLNGNGRKDDKICMDGTYGPAVRKNEVGSCPVSASEAADLHLRINASLRLAFGSALLSLDRFRENQKESLLLPLAQLRDLSPTNIIAAGAEADSLRKLKTILDQVGAETGGTTDSLDALQVDSVDDELQISCSLKNSQTTPAGLAARVRVEGVFDRLSKVGRELVNSGFSIPMTEEYRNFAARYLKTRCINAGNQYLFTGIVEASGLFRNVQFTNVTLVASDQIPTEGRTALTNNEIISNGRSTAVDFDVFMLGWNQARNSDGSRKPLQEVSAGLLGNGHLAIGMCKDLYGSGASDLSYCDTKLVTTPYLKRLKSMSPADFSSGGKFAGYNPDGSYSEPLPSVYSVANALPYLFAHLNLMTSPPTWLPQAEKDKYGEPTFPGSGFSLDSARYYLTSGDSGTTLSLFGLIPLFMLSTVQDRPVSGGLAVIPSSGGQDVPTSKSGDCR